MWGDAVVSVSIGTGGTDGARWAARRDPSSLSTHAAVDTDTRRRVVGVEPAVSGERPSAVGSSSDRSGQAAAATETTRSVGGGGGSRGHGMRRCVSGVGSVSVGEGFSPLSLHLSLSYFETSGLNPIYISLHLKHICPFDDP